MGGDERADAGHDGADSDEAFDPLAEANRQWRSHGLERPQSMHAAVSIIHAYQVVSTRIDRTLRPLGLTFARYEVLMLLSFSRSGALPITKVGERLLVHPTGATKLIDKLEARELVRRTPNPGDRRGTLAEITPEGRRLGRRASKLLGEIAFGVDLNEHELTQLIDTLRAVRSF